MKVLCSQEVVSPHVCGAVPWQVTAKASAPQVPWFVLCLWLQKGLQENMAWFDPSLRIIDIRPKNIYKVNYLYRADRVSMYARMFYTRRGLLR